MTPSEYKKIATQVRLETLKMVTRAKSSHIGSNFSIIDILTVLYNGVLKFDSKNPTWNERDRFILSKGHACASLYVTLSMQGFFPQEWLDKFYLPGGKLMGHAVASVPGVELSTGSLGHGLPVATGMALAFKRDGTPQRVFCLLSDGELDEGSNWEAILFAPHHKLDNLTIVIDYNKLQSIKSTHETLNLEPLVDKFKSFNWSVREVDGHNYDEIFRALNESPHTPGKPTCIIAHTTKGKGVDFMHESVLWHYRTPDEKEFASAISQLESQL